MRESMEFSDEACYCGYVHYAGICAHNCLYRVESMLAAELTYRCVMTQEGQVNTYKKYITMNGALCATQRALRLSKLFPHFKSLTGIFFLITNTGGKRKEISIHSGYRSIQYKLKLFRTGYGYKHSIMTFSISYYYTIL